MNQNTEPRCVIGVIARLIKVIPVTEVYLINELDKYVKSLWNQSPEALKTTYCWIPLTHILKKNVTAIDEEWKQQLLNIYMNIA